MLKRIFDVSLAYLVVVYLRMSTEMQNPRSPDQQLDEIKRRLKALGHPWNIVKVYCDEGKSAKFVRNRPEYLRMMRDIKTGAVVADLILVDTIERFGRVEELTTIRKELYEVNGVLVLAADNNFCDPLTPQGKALAMVESMRATEDGRIKAHNVHRGKRDAARQKHWPGGPVPYGLLSKAVMKTGNGRAEIDYCILVPDPETSWIIQLLFQHAAATGWGATRLARWLNEHSEIPDCQKPFHASTVGEWIDNPIYRGELLWNKNCTGVVADIRVVEPNPEEDWDRIPDFCEPLIPPALWFEVNALRKARSDRHKQSHVMGAVADGKLIQPSAPGMVITYLLSGLVYCHECGLRMTLSSGGAYVNAVGDKNNYAAYACPGNRDGRCSNSVRVPEKWLREVVVTTIRQRLFPWR